MWTYKNEEGKLPWEIDLFLAICHYVRLVFMQWKKSLKELNWVEHANDSSIGFTARYWQEAQKLSKAADDLCGTIP